MDTREYNQFVSKVRNFTMLATNPILREDIAISFVTSSVTCISR